MGNKCVGGSSNDDQVRKYMENDFVKPPKVDGLELNRSERYNHVKDEPTEHRMYGSGSGPSRGGHGFEWHSTFNGVPKVPLAVLVEHYQPYEFPICPVINSHTQTLVKNSWAKIIATEYDCEDTQSGKISGASYFYNHFFNQLFKRLADFSRIFPDIKSRADIFSKVMSFCISVRVEEIELVRVKLHHLGLMHKQIIHHPYLFGIYASNIHSTIRHCLGEDATYDVMSAWLHLLSFIMRGMLPSYFEGLPFGGHFSGAVNAASIVTEKTTEEVRNADEMRNLKKKLKIMNVGTASALKTVERTLLEEGSETSANNSGRSRIGGGNVGGVSQTNDRPTISVAPGEVSGGSLVNSPSIVGTPLNTFLEKKKKGTNLSSHAYSAEYAEPEELSA